MNSFARRLILKVASGLLPSLHYSFPLEDADPSESKQHRFGLSPMRFNNLSNGIYWITGASSGYGRSLSLMLLGLGATVFLSGRREDMLDKVVDEAHRLYDMREVKSHVLALDVTKKDQVEEAALEVMRRSPYLNGLLHCAAVPSSLEISNKDFPLDKSPEEAWDMTIDTNLKAPWRITRKIFPHMLKSKAPRVIMFSSGAGWADTPGKGIYNVSKAALNSLSCSMAAEYAIQYPDADIQINVLVPREAKTMMNSSGPFNPDMALSMCFALLTHTRGGPNGRLFHQNGIHLSFGNIKPYKNAII